MPEPLGQMVIELGLDSSAFGKGLTGAKQQVKYAMAEMKSGLSVMSASGKQLDILQTKQRGLSNVMTAQQKVVQSLKKSYDDSFVNGKATAATGRLATQLQNANAKLGSFRTQLANNAAAIAKARVETTGWTGALNKVSSGATATGQKLSAMGSTMTTRVSAPIVAGLGLAARAAINFDSQISAMGPLLTNGGAVTARYRAQLDQLAISSKKWSQQYGISTTEVNNAMSEMIKRGFSTKQVMGSMPAVLDASKASGEELGVVMQATASIVEQFGLKTNSVKGTMKNTQMVTDSLTYAANATAAGFGDMSEAMSYVGPVANGLGLSVQETAAAIGELSNKGIEGEKAGTNLRGMLTSLVKPTKQNQEAFTSMGISAKRLQEDSHNLPQLIDDITKGTSGWSKAERGKALAQAFGRENQAAANALVEAGSDSLRKLTKNTEDATGATKKVADQLNDTKANQIKRFESSLNVLGVTIGEKLLPTLTPLIKEATGVVNAFANMDNASQQWVIHMGLIAAATGPTMKLTGGLSKGFGFVGSSVVGVISKYEQWRAKSAVLNGSMQATESATNSVTGGISKTTSAMSTANSTITNAKGTWGLLGRTFLTTGGQAGVLGSAISPLGAAIIGTTAIVGAGAVAWELWGKKAFESSERSARWGSDVGATADKSLQKFQNFSNNSSAALQNWSINGEKSAKTVKKSFDEMADQIDVDAKKANKSLEDQLSKLPASVQALLQKSVQKSEDANNKAAASARKNAKLVDQIIQNSAKNHYKLTSDEAVMVNNVQQNMTDKELSILKIGGSKKKAVLAAINNDVKGMSQKQLKDNEATLIYSFKQEDKQYQKQKASLKEMYDAGVINAGQYKAALQSLGSTHKQTSNDMIQGLYNTMKAEGLSTTQMKGMFNTWGISWKSVKSIMKDASDAASQTGSALVKTTNNMSSKTKQAANDWNALIFDPKTGKVKTNAQDEINKATQSSEQWNGILLLAKKGVLSTNAQEMVAEAALSQGKWDSMTWKEQKAVIRSEGGADLIQLMENSGEWNGLTIDQKLALVNSKGGADLLELTSKLKIWNDLTPEEKKLAFDDASAKSKIVEAVGSVKKWDALSPKIQQLLASSNSPEVVAKGIGNVQTWNALPTSVKNLLANDSQAAAVLQAAGINIDSYNLKQPKQMFFNADSSNLDQTLANSINLLDTFNGKKPKTKTVKAKDEASGPIGAGIASVFGFAGANVGPTKNAKGKNSTSGPVDAATRSVNIFAGTSPGPTKNANGHNNASGPFGLATNSTNIWRGTSAGATKKAKAKDAASAEIKKAIKTMNHWKNIGDVSHTIKTIFKTIGKPAKEEKGTNNFQGGLAMVNDQMGATFREAIQEPNGFTYIPQGRNVVLPLQKHSKVIPAHKTARMFPGLPQFAKGLNVPADADIVQRPKQVVQNITTTQNVGPSNYGDNSLMTKKIKEMADNVSDLVVAIKKLNSMEAVVAIDSNPLIRLLAPLMTKEQEKLQNSSNRIRGIR